MVLRTLDVLGPLHGYGLARRIEQISGDRLTLNPGTLYPLLLRLEQEGAIASERGPSENNRSARFYQLTKAGRKQLEAETRGWEQTTALIESVLCREGEEISHETAEAVADSADGVDDASARRQRGCARRSTTTSRSKRANLRRGLSPAEARRRALLTEVDGDVQGRRNRSRRADLGTGVARRQARR